jgi:single-strand DNA-binding protein
MQQFTGRVTADATVKDISGGKQVVNFSIAEDQSYTPKGGDKVKVVTFFNCSYWMSTGVATVLRKGAVVQLNGRVSARAFQSNTGDLGASLNLQVNRIDVLAYAQGKGQNSTDTVQPDIQKSVPQQNKDVDDLPF